MEGEDEDVSSYWMTSRKREGSGKLKRMHSIVLCGEVAMEEASDQSLGRLQDGD
jgi:hypothetical protein